MKVRDAVIKGNIWLSNGLEPEILLAKLLHKSREFLISHPEFEISAESFEQFQDFCTKRANGIPLAYLTHHKEFYGLDFYVDERVFIPRPETEMLVEAVTKKLQITDYKLPITPLILDLGTGSGCIAISLAKNLPHVRILAVDISEGALEVAQKNAKFHGVSSQIEFIKSDLLENVIARPDVIASASACLLAGRKQSFGIVANLPYIGTTENHLVSREVLEHEPHSALFAGKNGLELYERLFDQIRAIRQSFDKLRMTKGDKAPKWLIGEIGFLQQEAIEKCIRKYFGNISVQFKNDLSGLPRMFSLCFKN